MGYAICIRGFEADANELDSWANAVNQRLRTSEHIVFEPDGEGGCVAIVKPFADLDILVDAIDALATRIAVSASDDFDTHIAGRRLQSPVEDGSEAPPSPPQPDRVARLTHVDVERTPWGIRVTYEVTDGPGVVMVMSSADGWSQEKRVHSAADTKEMVWTTPPPGPWEVHVRAIGTRWADRWFEAEAADEGWVAVAVSGAGKQQLALRAGTSVYPVRNDGYVDVPADTPLEDAMVVTLVDEDEVHRTAFASVDMDDALRAVARKHGAALLEACGSTEAAFAWLVGKMRSRKEVEGLRIFAGPETLPGTVIPAPELSRQSASLAVMGKMKLMHGYASPADALEALALLSNARADMLATVRSRLRELD